MNLAGQVRSILGWPSWRRGIRGRRVPAPRRPGLEPQPRARCHPGGDRRVAAVRWRQPRDPRPGDAVAHGGGVGGHAGSPARRGGRRTTRVGPDRRRCHRPGARPCGGARPAPQSGVGAAPGWDGEAASHDDNAVRRHRRAAAPTRSRARPSNRRGPARSPAAGRRPRDSSRPHRPGGWTSRAGATGSNASYCLLRRQPDVIDAPAQQCQVARHESVDGLDTEFIAEFAQVVVGVTPGTMVASLPAPCGADRQLTTHPGRVSTGATRARESVPQSPIGDTATPMSVVSLTCRIQLREPQFRVHD